MENFGSNLTNGVNGTTNGSSYTNTTNGTSYTNSTNGTNYAGTTGTTNGTDYTGTNGTNQSTNSSWTSGTTKSTNNAQTGLPAEISVWTKVKNFLFQEIQVTMTPKQAKVLQEVHDFWHQDITAKGIHDFLFQEIEIVDNITL